MASGSQALYASKMTWVVSFWAARVDIVFDDVLVSDRCVVVT